MSNGGTMKAYDWTDFNHTRSNSVEYILGSSYCRLRDRIESDKDKVSILNKQISDNEKDLADLYTHIQRLRNEQ